MQRAGAQMVYLFAFEVNMHVRLARNMRQQNFEPPLKVGNIAYNSKLIELLGDISNGWMNHIDHLPMLNEDEPARSPALREFITWNERRLPGRLDRPVPGERVGLVGAVRGGAAGHRSRCHPGAAAGQPRRQIKPYDGGGIRGNSDPSTGATDGCFNITKVESQKWVREYPAEGYECEPR